MQTNIICECKTWQGKPFIVDMEIAVDSGKLIKTNLDDTCGSCGGFVIIK